MKKKGIAVVLSLAMIVSVVTGCGKGNEKNTSQEIVTETMTEEENKEYSFEELTGYDSPLLGYWQGDDSACYIGYNTSPDNEGFIIWFKTKDILSILHPYEGYIYSGDSKSITYSPKNESANVPEVIVEIKDLNSIVISYDYTHCDDSYSNCPSTDYNLTKQDMDKNIIQAFEGEWVTEEQSNVDKNLQFDYIDGIIRPNDKNEDNGIEYNITLYDGEELMFISPDGYYEPENRMSLDYVSYKIEDDILYYGLGHLGGGGGIGWSYHRKGNEEVAVKQIDDIYPNDLDQYSLKEGNTFLEKVIFGGTDLNDLQTYFEGLPKHDFENGYPTSYGISTKKAELSGYDILGCRTDYTIYATCPLVYKEDAGNSIHTVNSRIEMLENDGESRGVYSTFEKKLEEQNISYNIEKLEDNACVTFMEVGINLYDSHDVSLEDSDEAFLEKSLDYKTVTNADLRSYFESITLDKYKKYTSIKTSGNIDGWGGESGGDCCYSFVIDEIPWNEYTGIEEDAILIVIDIPDYCFDYAPEDLEGVGIDFVVSVYSKADYLSEVEEE